VEVAAFRPKLKGASCSVARREKEKEKEEEKGRVMRMGTRKRTRK